MVEQIAVKISEETIGFNSVPNNFPAQESWLPNGDNILYWNYGKTSPNAMWVQNGYGFLPDVYIYAVADGGYYRGVFTAPEPITYDTQNALSFINGNVFIDDLTYVFEVGQLISYNVIIRNVSFPLNNTVTDDEPPIVYSQEYVSDIISVDGNGLFIPAPRRTATGDIFVVWGYGANFDSGTNITFYFDHFIGNDVFHYKLYDMGYDTFIQMDFNEFIFEDGILYSFLSTPVNDRKYLVARPVDVDSSFDFTIFKPVFDDSELNALFTSQSVSYDFNVVNGGFLYVIYTDIEGNSIVPYIITIDKYWQRYWRYNIVGNDAETQSVISNSIDPDIGGSISIFGSELHGPFSLTGGENPIMFYAISGDPPIPTLSTLNIQNPHPLALPCQVNCLPFIDKRK